MDQGQPDAIHPLVMKLNELLVLESKFQPHLQLPNVSQDPTEITTGIRDGSAHVLRCLKVWYDLPSDVLFVAINLMDRFLTKMKARPKHMACISVSSFHLATRQVYQYQKSCGMEDVSSVPDTRDLVAISQCKCTLGDLNRMEGIISSKLDTEPGLLPVTPLTFLQLFHALFAAAAGQIGVGALYEKMVASPSLWLRLEILACDAACANFRPSELALVLLCTQLDSGVAELGTRQDPSTGAEIMRLVNFAIDLQKMCKIADSSFFCCHEVVLLILARYNAQCQMPHRQRLVWKLSQRTLRYLRPTDKLTSIMPTIDEHGQLQMPARMRSGSVSSDESWDSEKEDTSAEWVPSLNPVEWTVGAMNPLPEEDEPVSKDASSKFLCDAMAA
ncbi:cyclin G isoform X1 [Periplaneta americana]|uniref:cyclin G isoform X1 n=1 Tax=Periplaneta americana TaxID=6978 RepID=UPI0037E9208B